MASFNTKVTAPTTLGGGDTAEALASQAMALAALCDALIVAYIAGTNLVDVDAEVEAIQDWLIAYTAASYTTV
jgi:hypothetical protein